MTYKRRESGHGWVMYLGDCAEVMSGLGRVDHVITDPPYEREAHTKLRRSCTKGKSPDGKRNFRDAPLSFGAMTPELRAQCGFHFARLARRWILVFCQVEGIAPWRARLEGAGARHRRAMVWIKPDGTPQFTGDRPGTGYETIYAAYARDGGRSKWNGGGRRGVFVHSAHTQLRGMAEHETKKPPALMLELVSLFTDPGDVVLDAFAGSAQTGLACLRLGRRFVGIESDPVWFDRSCEALDAESRNSTVSAVRGGQLALLDALHVRPDP